MTVEDIVFSGPQATLESIMRRKELRTKEHRDLLLTGGTCLVGVSLNIPGAQKRFPLAKCALAEGIAYIRLLYSDEIISQREIESDSGYEAMFLLEADPLSVKRELMMIEDRHPLGRLFDFDVIDQSGTFISRVCCGGVPRKCMVCENNAKICYRSKAHSYQQLRHYTAHTLFTFFFEKSKQVISKCIQKALLYEVSITPKPGLVDRNNSGAHQDMDFYSFIDSSAVLSLSLLEIFDYCYHQRGQVTEDLFMQIRLIGKRIEQRMYLATNGVNTHKGVVFSFGILCAALGLCHAGLETTVSLLEMIDICQQLGVFALADFEKSNIKLSHGIDCYRLYQALGARGEAANGFSSAVNVALPFLRKKLSAGFSLNDAAALTLLMLLSQTVDTNILHRGGSQKARAVQIKARCILNNLNTEHFYEELKAFDDELIEENLSPGGCADQLAVSLFLLFLEEEKLVSFEDQKELPDSLESRGVHT